MSSNKMLEKINDAIEEAIRPIIGKGANMNATELDVLTKAVCTLEKIKQIENGESYAEYSRNSYDGNNSYDENNSYRRGRSATTGRYVSRDDGYSSRRYYDGDNSRNEYSGHSIEDRMISQLQQIYDTAKTDHERQLVNDWIRRLRTIN